MFDTVATSPQTSRGLNFRLLPLAAAVHGLGLVAWLVLTMWEVKPVAIPNIVEPFIAVQLPPLEHSPAPPAPRPAPVRQAAQAPAPEPQQPEPKAPVAPPVIQPETIPMDVVVPTGPVEATEYDPNAGAATGPVGEGPSGGCLENCDENGGGTGEEGPIVVGAGMTPPHEISRTVPVYPETARKARRSGRVVIQAVIDTTGAVREAWVTSNKLGFGLEESALAAVKQWRFSPALRSNGDPVAVYFILTVDFGLS